MSMLGPRLSSALLVLLSDRQRRFPSACSYLFGGSFCVFFWRVCVMLRIVVEWSAQGESLVQLATPSICCVFVFCLQTDCADEKNKRANKHTQKNAKKYSLTHIHTDRYTSARARCPTLITTLQTSSTKFGSIKKTRAWQLHSWFWRNFLN